MKKLCSLSMPSLAACSFLLLSVTSPGDVIVAQDAFFTGSVAVPGVLPGINSATVTSVTVQDGDAIAFAYSNNKKITHVSGATVKLTSVGDPGAVQGTFSNITHFNGAGDGNDSGGLFWLNGLSAGTYDVVADFQFESGSSNAGTGQGLLVLRPSAGHVVALETFTTGGAAGLNAQDLDLVYTGLSTGGVLFEALASNDNMTADPGGTRLYESGATNKRTAWYQTGVSGDVTSTYTYGFGATNSDTASGGGAYFGEMIIPEPSSLALLFAGLGAFLLRRQRGR